MVTKETEWPLLLAYDDLWSRRKVAAGIAVLAFFQLAVLVVQIVGVLDGDAAGLSTDEGGTIKAAPRYHLFVGIQSFLVILQLVGITWWYILRVRNLSHLDRLWAETPLLFSSHRGPFLCELAVLALHEPPGLVLAWSSSYKLQILALLRVYTVFTILRSMSMNTTLSGRMICSIATVANSKGFQIRTWMHLYPIPFVMLCTLLGYIVLALAMYIAEAGDMQLDDACWLTFITMTTVGYGDLSPISQVGRIIACLTAVHGLVSSALLISAVSNLFTLSPQQGRVIEFMTEAKMTGTMEDLAVRIIQRIWKLHMSNKKKPESARYYELSTVRHLCAEHRRARRHYKHYMARVHNSEQEDINGKLADIQRKLGVCMSVLAFEGNDSRLQEGPQGLGISSEPFSQGNTATANVNALREMNAKLEAILDNQREMMRRQDLLEGCVHKSPALREPTGSLGLKSTVSAAPEPDPSFRSSALPGSISRVSQKRPQEEQREIG